MSVNDTFWGNYKPSRVVETAWNLYKFSKRTENVRAATWWDLELEEQQHFVHLATILVPDPLHPNHNYRENRVEIYEQTAC